MLSMETGTFLSVELMDGMMMVVKMMTWLDFFDE